jgi:DNA-3-methyladenine glycosylase I
VALAGDLRRHGIRFVGPTTAQALMEAVGIVDAHLVGCHRRGAGA